MNTKTRILIVEDEPLVAASLKRMLSKADYEIVAIAHRREIAIYELTHAKPDLVLLDINLGGEMHGIEVGELISAEHRLPFIYVTAYTDRKTIDAAKMTQPAGYIVKPFDEAEVLVNVEIALHNHAQKLKSGLIELDWSLFNQHAPEPLSKRELEVLKLIFDGKTNAQMADSLFVSINTIKSHLFRVYQKLSVTSRTEAIAKARTIFQNI